MRENLDEGSSTIFVQIMELLKLFERSNLFFFYRVNSLLLDYRPCNFWQSSQVDNKINSKINQWAFSQEFEPFAQNWKLRSFNLSAFVKVFDEAVSIAVDALLHDLQINLISGWSLDVLLHHRELCVMTETAWHVIVCLVVSVILRKDELQPDSESKYFPRRWLYTSFLMTLSQTFDKLWDCGNS